jgi:hypothetical protein
MSDSGCPWVKSTFKIKEMLTVACRCELGTNFSVLKFMITKARSCNVSAAKLYENFVRESMIALKVMGRFQTNIKSVFFPNIIIQIAIICNSVISDSMSTAN